MSITDEYKQLRMIENIKNSKEMETSYNANLKLCKYQEQQINKLATCIEQIKEIAEAESYLSPQSTRLLVHKILQKISEYKGGYNEKIR